MSIYLITQIRQPQIAKIIKLRGPIRGRGTYRQFVVRGWGLIREGGYFEGGQFEDLRYPRENF